MKKIILISTVILLSVLCFENSVNAQSTNITVEATIYGKGGASGDAGKGTLIICPIASNDVCAKIKVDLHTVPISRYDDYLGDLTFQPSTLYLVETGKRYDVVIEDTNVRYLDLEEGVAELDNVSVFVLQK
ncbi:MAG: hypothetical protein LBS01_03540 [Prevotellaceae bacterium]|jgi:hypothetical protein|nr:hypothetical protein [Prevotellaceae bacterium]